MANFLPFKDDFENNNSFAPARTRRATEAIFSNFLSYRGNYKRSGCSLARSASAPQATRVPFLRLNSYGAEETDCPQFCFALQQQQKLQKTGFASNAKVTNFTSNMDWSHTSKICQVVDGIRECCSNLIKRDLYKPRLSSSFCATVRTDVRKNCDSCNFNCDFNRTLPQQEIKMPVHVSADSLSSYQAAPSSQTNGNQNDYGTDWDVNEQLIVDLIGDCIGPLLHHDVIKPAEKCATNEKLSLTASTIESKFCSESSASALPCNTSIPTVSQNDVECVSEDMFLAHTMQQRINKESRRAARKRKRNRQAKSSLSCVEVDDTVMQLFDNCTASFLSTSPVCSGLQTLCVSPNAAHNVSFSLSDDGEEEEGEADSDSDDDDEWQVTFSDSFGVISLDSCNGITRLRPTLHHYGSPDSTCSDNSDKLSGDHEDEVHLIREEIQRANSRWKECYGSFGSNVLDNWLSIDDSDEQYPVCRVSFANGPSLVTEHELDDADEVRKGPWEEMYVDRQRFQKRVADVAAAIEPVLDREHRAKVFCSRNLFAHTRESVHA